MKLYIYEHCPFCTRARMIFGLKGLPVELAVILEGDAATPLRLIGKKAVPILQKADGTHLGESLDIVRHVDAIGTPVLTAPPSEAQDSLWPFSRPRAVMSSAIETSSSVGRAVA